MSTPTTPAPDDGAPAVHAALTEINRVFQLGEAELASFAAKLFLTSRETQQTFDAATEAAQAFSRQGLSSEETLTRTRDALILARLAGLDCERAVEALTAALAGFKPLASTEVIARLAATDARFAVSSSDLAAAIERVGASAEEMGISLEDLIALFKKREGQS